MASRIKELGEEYEISELDEQDKLRIVLDVEREMQERVFVATKTSLVEENEINDRDAMALDDRETSTDDLEDFVLQQGVRKFIEKECQVEGLVDMISRGMVVDPQRLGILVTRESMTDKVELVEAVADQIDTLEPNEPQVRRRRLTIIEENEIDGVSSSSEDHSGADDDSDNDEDEDLKKYVESLGSLAGGELAFGSGHAFKSRMSVSLPATDPIMNTPPDLDLISKTPVQEATKLIGTLALTLVKRANDLLDGEIERIEKIASISPAKIANELRASLKIARGDVETMTNEIQKKQSRVKKSLRVIRKNELSMKQTSERVDGLEMDNYNLREQLQEQFKMIEDYRALLNELVSLIEYDKLTPQAEKRAKEIVTQLTELLN